MRICMNNELNIVKKTHELQHGNCTKEYIQDPQDVPTQIDTGVIQS